MSVVEQQGVTVPEPALPVVRPRRRRGPAAWMGRGAGGLLVLALLVFMVGPLVWLALRAFSGLWQFPQLIPHEWTLKWWSSVFKDKLLLHSIKLSFIFAPIVTML